MKSVKLTPVDITNKEFRKMLRGYDPEEVDEFCLFAHMHPKPGG